MDRTEPGVIESLQLWEITMEKLLRRDILAVALEDVHLDRIHAIALSD